MLQSSRAEARIYLGSRAETTLVGGANIYRFCGRGRGFEGTIRELLKHSYLRHLYS